MLSKFDGQLKSKRRIQAIFIHNTDDVDVDTYSSSKIEKTVHITKLINNSRLGSSVYLVEELNSK